MLPATQVRNKIMAFEHLLRDCEQPVCPLIHTFAPGAYARQILLPKGSVVIGKIHKHAHLNMIMQGHVSVKTEDGTNDYFAPLVFTSKPGTKRVVYAHEDTIWVTVHLTDSQELAVIEDEIIAKTFDEYDKFAIEHLSPKVLTTLGE